VCRATLASGENAGGPSIPVATIDGNSGPIENAQIAVLDLRDGSQKVVLRGGSDARYVEGGYLVYGVAGTLGAVAFDAADTF
jgi:hypothetical protein